MQCWNKEAFFTVEGKIIPQDQKKCDKQFEREDDAN